MRFARTIAATAVTSAALASATFVALAPTASAGTATLVNESFTDATTTSLNWVRPPSSDPAAHNEACLTGSSDPAATPVPGCGATTGAQAGLQLTTSGQGKEGGLAYTSSVPSSLGLDVTFDSYQYAPRAHRLTGSCSTWPPPTPRTRARQRSPSGRPAASWATRPKPP